MTEVTQQQHDRRAKEVETLFAAVQVGQIEAFDAWMRFVDWVKRDRADVTEQAALRIEAEADREWARGDLAKQREANVLRRAAEIARGASR